MLNCLAVGAGGFIGSVLNPRLILFLKVGICGGFTTFSTFALESARLFEDGRGVIAVTYIALSAVLSVLAVLAAEALVK